MGRLAHEIGRALRRARRERQLTLRGVSDVTEGRFRPTSVAGYERGERAISVERFIDLCEVYRVHAPSLLAEILRAEEGVSEPELRPESMEALAPAERALVSGFIRQIRALRRGPPTETIVLRTGDLQVLATATGKEPAELIEELTARTPRQG